MYMQVGKLVSWFADIELTNVNPTYQKQLLRIAMYKQVASVFHFCRDFCRGTSVVKVINTIEGGYRKGQFAKGSVTTNADTRQRELKLTSVLSKEACLTCLAVVHVRAESWTLDCCCLQLPFEDHRICVLNVPVLVVPCSTDPSNSA
jgi:hypothetical protein